MYDKMKQLVLNEKRYYENEKQKKHIKKSLNSGFLEETYIISFQNSESVFQSTKIRSQIAY